MPNEISSKLTTADWHLLDAVSRGIGNKALAAALCKSEFTVRNRLSPLYKKINVGNRNQAAFWYRTHHAHQLKSLASANTTESGRST